MAVIGVDEALATLEVDRVHGGSRGIAAWHHQWKSRPLMSTVSLAAPFVPAATGSIRRGRTRELPRIILAKEKMLGPRAIDFRSLRAKIHLGMVATLAAGYPPKRANGNDLGTVAIAIASSAAQ